MKNKDLLRLEQLEDSLRPYRSLADRQPPTGGWIRAIREALGMSSTQLAKRGDMTAAQSVEDIQESEVTGTIQLRTLQKLARALDGRLVYAIVPTQPLPKMRRNRALEIARNRLSEVSHTMKLEAQGLGRHEESRQLKLLTEKILAGNPKKLWE